MFSCDVKSSNCDQFELLKKLQLENEKLEEDTRAPPPSSLKKFHSRQGSTSSLLSVISAASSGSSIYHNCSQEISPSFPTMTFQEQSSSSSSINRSIKSKSNASSSAALAENWNSWLIFISEWEHALKHKQKLTKFHQKASDLFRQTWCIPEALRGLVWQLVSGAREENAACVILNPSAAITGSTCLVPSSLLSTEHLFCFPSDGGKDGGTAKELNFNGKTSFTMNQSIGNVETCMKDNHIDSEAAQESTYRANTQHQSSHEPLNENPLNVRECESSEKTETREPSSNLSRQDLQPSGTIRYADLLLLPSSYEKTISRDISRTYPNHSKFKDSWGEGQESLFNVARAYSVYDQEVGYCQGSSFIIGLLLMHMPEEDAFGVFIRIMYAYNLRDLFKPSMQALGLKMFQLDHLIQDNLPDLHSVFSGHGIQTSMFASPWFLTLFATNLPLSLVFQVFDAFLCQGSDVIFLLGLALLKINQNFLIGLCMEDLVQFLQKDLGVKAETDSSLFFATAFHFKVNAKKMKKLEKEYAEIENQERNQQTEICQLRSENRRLQMLVEKLEKETGSLADQLITRQIQCAELTEETSALRHAVASARKLLVDHNVLTHNGPKNITDNSSKCGVAKYLEDMKPNLSSLLESDEVESLREELIGCKLREAESNLSIKKLQHEIHEIEKLWNKVQPKLHDVDVNSTPQDIKCTPTISTQEFNLALLTCHVREANLLSELADAKLDLASIEHKASCLEKKNLQLQKQITSSNLEVGSLIEDNKNLSEKLQANEENQDKEMKTRCE